MCGVRLERRKEQRRIHQASAVKCASCGYLNDFGTKFCGMCGISVDRRAIERRTAGPRAAAIANAQLPTPEIPGWPSSVATQVDPLVPPAPDEIEARNAAAAIFRSQPSPHNTISGPSFLGLGNDPANGNSDYLLDDDASSSGGVGKIVFFVVLILIGGLSYMGWRSGFFTKIQASAPARTPSVPVPAPTASPAVQPAEQSGATAVPDLAPPAANKSTVPPLPGDSSDAQKAATSSGADDPPSAPGATTSDDSQADNRADKSKAPKEMPTPARRKPSTALIQAQNYLQGRGGVRQDCEQGLIYLKAATEKNDPAAAVQMGALYASGHCVQQDRVMAYRWFNSAHELDPANPWIQTNLDQLWAQMTAAERKQVAR